MDQEIFNNLNTVEVSKVRCAPGKVFIRPVDFKKAYESGSGLVLPQEVTSDGLLRYVQGEVLDVGVPLMTEAGHLREFIWSDGMPLRRGQQVFYSMYGGQLWKGDDGTLVIMLDQVHLHGRVDKDDDDSCGEDCVCRPPSNSKEKEIPVEKQPLTNDEMDRLLSRVKKESVNVG